MRINKKGIKIMSIKYGRYLKLIRRITSVGPTGLMTNEALKIVARATTINRIIYAVPAWRGYAIASDKKRIQQFLDRVYKSRFLTDPHTDIERQMTAADDNLLRAVVRNDRHNYTKTFVPPEKRCIYDLRPRAHNFNLPLKDSNNFIFRLLFRL